MAAGMFVEREQEVRTMLFLLLSIIILHIFSIVINLIPLEFFIILHTMLILLLFSNFKNSTENLLNTCLIVMPSQDLSTVNFENVLNEHTIITSLNKIDVGTQG